MCTDVINWVGLYQRNYFSPQLKCLLSIGIEVVSALQSNRKTIFKHTHLDINTHTQFHMTTSAHWDKQAHRWSGVTLAGRLWGCAVKPCCDSILSVPECALLLLQRETAHSWNELHMLCTGFLSNSISHTPSSGCCVCLLWRVFLNPRGTLLFGRHPNFMLRRISVGPKRDQNNLEFF